MRQLLCYLRRRDNTWYELGAVYRWRTAFGVFPGWPDGSLILHADHAPLLARRLDGHDHSLEQRQRYADDVIRWADGQRVRFMSDLELPDDRPPTPITGRLPGCP